ncbi:cation/H(+) antiporter 15-like [Rhodamnia argentea]|uniref:Cation/H(+) antiporter 15-like n=1 Tax=Rhodamnia argentea TaxID=178133 RepID=A0A8B8PIM8_9MYRT|nr:cation/H(+) antiporter 15-like [Rhodamnia argentea]
MDRQEVVSRMTDQILVIGNKTVVCQQRYEDKAKSIWLLENPLNLPTPLIMFQLILIFFVTRLVHLALKPLGQLTIVSQLFGGILLGPSVLGRNKALASIIFPPRSETIIETFTMFGVMFFLFCLGVKMDPATMLRPGRKAVVIGSSMLLFSLVVMLLLSVVLQSHVAMDSSFTKGLPYVAGLQALTGFPVISSLLIELRIHNTDLGRLAISSSMVCDLIWIGLAAIGTGIEENGGRAAISGLAIATGVALLLTVVFVLKPLILWMIRNTQPGKTIDEATLVYVTLLVLLTGFVGESVGQHYLGPLVLGLMVPDGPPLGTAIESRLELFTSGLLYPAFVSLLGLRTDVFQIHYKSLWILAFLVVVSFLVKFGVVVSAALYSKIPIREALALGLILNGKGIIELVLYNVWRNGQVLTDELFSLCVMSTILVTGITTPFVKALYDPSRQFISARRSSIQHNKPNSELRILVCVDGHDSVPTMISLLEVSHASEESPIAVMAMVLVDLIGRTTTMLVCHKNRVLDSSSTMSGHIVNAFRNYEHHNEGRVMVETFTAISDFDTMHVDICQVALDKRANIVIVPFHKQWAVDGQVGKVNRAVQNMNLHVLEQAPCSVGILIDRGIVRGTLTILTSESTFHVAVLFIGGPDDAESLAYGSRMAKHENVIVTVIRFLLFGSENTKDRRIDTELIYDYRHSNMGNERFVYVEEVVRDGVALASFIRRVVNLYDLILIGRQHQASPIFTGLEQWSECPELGVIPDMLASPDFESTASVLVIQQQRIGGALMAGHAMQPAMHHPRDQAFAPSTVLQDEAGRASWSISIEKGGRTT